MPLFLASSDLAPKRGTLPKQIPDVFALHISLTLALHVSSETGSVPASRGGRKDRFSEKMRQGAHFKRAHRDTLYTVDALLALGVRKERPPLRVAVGPRDGRLIRPYSPNFPSPPCRRECRGGRAVDFRSPHVSCRCRISALMVVVQRLAELQGRGIPPPPPHPLQSR